MNWRILNSEVLTFQIFDYLILKPIPKLLTDLVVFEIETKYRLQLIIDY